MKERKKPAGKVEFGSPEGGELIFRALKRGIRRALWKHKQLGNPVAVSRDEKLVILQPEEIEIPSEFDENSNDDLLLNRMTNDYCVNASIVYDLSDARKEIDSILELFSPDEGRERISCVYGSSLLSHQLGVE